MVLREVATVVIIIAVLLGYLALHEASHMVNKNPGQPVTTVTK